MPRGRHVSNDHVSNFLGRKGSFGISKSTPVSLSALTLEDVTNPGEEGEIAARYSKGIEEVEFRSKAGSVKEGNDDNALVLTVAKSNISYPDENGMPQHIRDKFVGIQSVIGVGHENESNVTLQESWQVALFVGLVFCFFFLFVQVKKVDATDFTGFRLDEYKVKRYWNEWNVDGITSLICSVMGRLW